MKSSFISETRYVCVGWFFNFMNIERYSVAVSESSTSKDKRVLRYYCKNFLVNLNVITKKTLILAESKVTE